MSETLTGETITDEQIRELWNIAEMRKLWPHAGEVRNVREFRSRCAALLRDRRGSL